MIENLSKIIDIHNQLPVQINKPIDELNQIEKRILAQRVGIANIRRIPKAKLETLLEEKELNISEIKPRPVRYRISVKKPLLQQAKDLGYQNFHKLNIKQLQELLSQPPVTRFLKIDFINQATDLGLQIKP